MKRLFPTSALPAVEAIAKIAYCNPFTKERIEWERAALGSHFAHRGTAWNLHADSKVQNPNLAALLELTGERLAAARRRLTESQSWSERDIWLYESLVFVHLYHRYAPQLDSLIDRPNPEVSFYGRFAAEAEELLGHPAACNHRPETPDLLAFLFQIRRAFHYIYFYLVGGSRPMSELRAAIWESVFTHSMERYRAGLFERMGDFSTLITGPSGTGKELVAHAIGSSLFVPFLPSAGRFVFDPASAFHPLNLSALSATLIESELFGARKGAYTGADRDHAGRLEQCGPEGAVFLDEIGELDPAIQVKLLRLLQTRTFERIGESHPRKFRGKFVSATNRNLAEEIEAGRFRQDFYYRLCADRVETPSLRAQIADSEEELPILVKCLLQRNAGMELASELTDSHCQWIVQHLGRDYAWPGNVRELEQCVRSLLIHGHYQPISKPRDLAMNPAHLSLEQAISRHCTETYHRTGSYVAAAKALDTDRRTVKARLDENYLKALRESGV